MAGAWRRGYCFQQRDTPRRTRRPHFKPRVTMYTYTTPAQHARYANPARSVYAYPSMPRVAPPSMPTYYMQGVSQMVPTPMRSVSSSMPYARPTVIHAQHRAPSWPLVNHMAASVPAPVQAASRKPVVSAKPLRNGLDRKLYSVLFFFAFWMILSCLFVGYYVARSI